jgi:hypothetical protein
VFDEERGWEELETLFSDQWADGMVASINFHRFSNTYFPGPEIWGTPEKPSKTTGITQPPVAAITARFMYEYAEQKDLARSKIEELFPKLLAWHRWWYKVNRQHTNNQSAQQCQFYNYKTIILQSKLAKNLRFEISCFSTQNTQAECVTISINLLL